MLVLDILATNNWERPIYFIGMGGNEVEIGQRNYMQYEGFVYKFVPINTSQLESGNIHAEKLYDRLKNVYQWGNMDKEEVNIDYNNLFTLAPILNIRDMHARTAKALLDKGEKEKTIEILDQAVALTPPYNFPYNLPLPTLTYNEFAVLQLIELYYQAEEAEKAANLAEAFFRETQQCLRFFSRITKADTSREFQQNMYYLSHLANILTRYNDEELGTKVKETIQTFNRIFGFE